MKPLCSICLTHHEPYQGHVFAKEPVANAVANKKRKPGRYRDAAKRREYMRDLMRKRRAKADDHIASPPVR